MKIKDYLAFAVMLIPTALIAVAALVSLADSVYSETSRAQAAAEWSIDPKKAESSGS